VGLNRKGLEQRIQPGDRVLIDTSVLIAYFGKPDADETHPLGTMLIDEFVMSGRNEAVVSPVTAMELLVRPLKAGPRTAVHVHDFLTQTAHLRLLPTDLHVAQEAATLRATYNFRAADALVAGTGIVAQVAHLVTNDKDWQKKLAPLKARTQVTYLRNYLTPAAPSTTTAR
jgi:predicted nucleic acid-binding protein